VTTTYEVNTIEVPEARGHCRTPDLCATGPHCGGHTRRAAHLLIAIRCTECREEHRVRLDDEQLDAVAYLSADFQHMKLSRGAELLANAAREASKLAPDIVAAFVWQLTHATAHEERKRRVDHLRRSMAASDILSCDHAVTHVAIDGDTGIPIDPIVGAGPWVKVVKP
jgi:hypothetical protein